MMYWVRCAILSVSVFFLVYVALSAILAGLWGGTRKYKLLVSADALFSLRILPLFGALVFVGLITIPSFWSLEPSSIEEGIGINAALLFAASAAWILFRCARIVASWRKASKFFALATPLMRRLDLAKELEVYELPGAGFNLFVSGLFRPKLLISREALQLLDEQEMQAAVRHEMAHAHSLDNIKQLMMRFCAFPFLESLDREWLRAVEIAADDRAAVDESTAADLASALIKVGNGSAQVLVPELGMSLVPESDAPVSARVRRLLSWEPRQKDQSINAQWFVALSAIAIIAVNSGWLMSQMHNFTEVLFR